MEEMPERHRWRVWDHGVIDEPFAKSLIEYRQWKTRGRATTGANVHSSSTDSGLHLPIIDLDFPHQYVPSTTPGHGHLLLNVPISPLRWTLLMLGLYAGGVIELGFLVWSLRRGANFARLPGVKKTADEQYGPVHYGWFFRRRG